MNFQKISIISILFYFSCMPALWADDADMKNDKVLASEILKMQTVMPEGNPLWIRAVNLIGWRFLDKTNQTLGKVETAYFNPETGQITAIKIDQEALVFENEWVFDVKAHNLRIEDHVVRSDLDRKIIKSEYKPFGIDPLDISLAELLKSPIFVDGAEIGKIGDLLIPAKEMTVTHARLYLKNEKKWITLPLAAISFRKSTGQWQGDITASNWKLIQEYIK